MSDCCFICTNADGPLYSVCKCNTYIHEKCFEKLVNVKSHSTHCAVCRVKYNITFVHAKRCVIEPTCIMMTTLLMMTAIFIYVHVVGFHIYMQIAITSIVSLSIFMSILYFSYFYKMTGKCCCCRYEQKVVRKIIELPHPVNTI